MNARDSGPPANRAAAASAAGVAFATLARPHAVIFDMDGTLLDTETLALRAWTAAAAALGVEFDHAVGHALIGKNFADSRAHLHRHFAGSGYPVDALLAGWPVHFDAIAAREGVIVKEGAPELLAELRSAGIPLAVATSTRRERARAKLADAGLLEHFVTVIGGDDVARGKPAPDIYLAAAAALGIAPAQCLAIEDSETGFRAAHAAGMTTILVPDLAAPGEALLALAPRVAASLHEVRALLAR